MYKKSRYDPQMPMNLQIACGDPDSLIATYRRVNKSHGLVPEFCNLGRFMTPDPSVNLGGRRLEFFGQIQVVVQVRSSFISMMSRQEGPRWGG